MIVACPNCKSKYNVPEGKIAPGGSKLRCARCKHVFTVMPPGKEFEDELSELVAAEPKAAAPRTPEASPQSAPPQPAPKAPTPEPETPATPQASAEQARPEAPAAEAKMPWETELDEPKAPQKKAPASPAAEAKMPWEEDEEPAGEADAAAGKTPEEPGKTGGFGAALAAESEAGEAEAEESGEAPEGEDEAKAEAPAESAGDAAAETSKSDGFLDDLDAGPAFPAKGKKAGGKKRAIVGVIILVLMLAAATAYYFRNSLNIPFLSEPAQKESSDAAEKVKDIALRNVRQYYIPNEKTGNVFVVEGKAVNNFATPKERIKVEVSLYDEKGHVLASKQLLCGNTLSQFQLQVQSEEEINASLSSEVGILTSNTYLKTGMDTPFMAVFFKPPEAVKEFGVKVIDAQNPK